MEKSLIYLAYVLAAVGALAIYAGLPKDGRPSRSGLVVVLMALGVGAMVMLLEPLLGAAAGRAYFVLFALLAVGGAVRVVTHPRPVNSALYFILVVLSTAGLMCMSGAAPLGFFLLIVYAGAILVTYVFVIMLAQQNIPQRGMFSEALHYDRNAREPLAAVVAGFVLVGTLAGVIVAHPNAVDAAGGAGMAPPADGTVLALGRLLLVEYAVSVELAGLLLLVAMIGAIAVARKKLPRMDDGAEPLPPGEIGKRVSPF